jgi:hypothetical protein
MAVQFPPIMDLPQQVSQIRLLGEWLNNDPDHAQYTIQWFKPGNASYIIMGGCWSLFGPDNAGRAYLIVNIFIWVISIHVLAARLSKPVAVAILGSILAYNLSFYCGFLSFLLGFPFFLFLIYVLKSYSVRTWQGVLMWIAGGLLLYSAHILWFFFGISFVIIQSLLHRENKADLLLKLASFVTLGLVAVPWSIDLSRSVWKKEPLWVLIPFIERLSPTVIVHAALGSLTSPILYLCLAAIATYILIVILIHKKDLWESIDKDLLLASAMLLLATQVLPDLFAGTLFFSDRWLAPGIVALLLSLHCIPWNPQILASSFCVIVGLYSAVTTVNWMEFEKEEMSGLTQAISALPASSSVFGVALNPESNILTGVPRLHMFAYAQVLKGGKLNFSFAQFHNSLVMFKDPRPLWGRILVQLREVPPLPLLYGHEYLLVGADDSHHRHLASTPYLRARTNSGNWRLYKIERKTIEGARGESVSDK